VVIEDQKYISWKAPDSFAAGWQNDSALLGMPGNTVLNGHSSYSKDGIKLLDGVFKDLVNLKPGDSLSMFSSSGVEYHFSIATKVLLKERWQPVEIRLQNSSWMLPSKDERITLVTCWPYGSNTHRLIVIALPVKPGD
jgi:sortase A